MEATTHELKAGFNIILAVTEAIREARELPSGTLYALLCGKMDLPTYERMIQILKNTKLVEEKAHMLRWIGPEISQ